MTTPAEQAARALEHCSRAVHKNESEQAACQSCVAQAIEQARREERKACAKIVETLTYAYEDGRAGWPTRRDIAAAIRARAQEAQRP